MSKKEKVSILRTDDFEVVDEALSDALSGLDSTNTRISELLEQQASVSEEEAAAEVPSSDTAASVTAKQEDDHKETQT